MKYLKKKRIEVPFCRNCVYLQEHYNALTLPNGAGYGYPHLYLPRIYICSHPERSIYVPLSIGNYPPADYKSPKCPLRYINKGDNK